MQPFQIFIVEDDEWYGEILGYHLSLNPDYQVTRFDSGKELLCAMNKKPDLITIDFSMPEYRGDKLLEKIKEINPHIPVIVISSQEDISVAVKLLKMGATDYIVKDNNTIDLLWNAILKVRENKALKKEVEQLRNELGDKYSFNAKHSFSNILKGQSKAVNRVFELMGKAIHTNINVSITGETGTGKELVARAIHYNCERKKKPFVEVNMAAIPRELLESELMGHEKGAFTGAVARKIGKFEEANGGTIFLDEIAEMDFSLQSKILRVLQERELVRVGGNEKIKLDIRLIVATHKDLHEEVQRGSFREDLFFRILGLPIELPPLRERDNDILILAKYFVDEFAKGNKMQSLELTQEAKEKLMQYNYPGNVRELKAMIELAAVMCNEKEIKADDITFTTKKRTQKSVSIVDKTLKEHNSEIIGFYLKKYDNNVPLVANKLEIGRSTIYKMLQLNEIAVC
ncbi:MAG: sigma-54 dependent transcriptional regulator [Bacteroidota bacterium]|nr:sigma-54 dependent transcriptional regulator [Bacteroidota bacterium]